MNIKSILSYCVLAAATFGLAACADTDAQYTIPDVDAPVVVSTTPADGSNTVRGGDITITVEYDKNVFFYSENASQISITGGTISSADVIGTSNTLTIKANCQGRGTAVTVTIPAGLVTGPNSVPAPETTLSFTTVDLDTAPVMATSARATALYSYLLQNFETKTLSGMMANVAWNTDEAEQVYQWTDKYPAINGFDYIHMPASEAGENWINYTDITPVRDWANNNGIVTMTWHWLVPKEEISTSGCVIPSDWSGSLQLTDADTKTIMQGASVGDAIVVVISDVAEGAQGSIKDSNWGGFVDESGTSWEYFDISGDSYSMTLDATTLADIQANGFILSGHDYTVEGVYLVPAGAEIADGTVLYEPNPFSSLDPNNDYTYVPGETAFSASNALTEGTWENEVWKHDMAVVIKYLTLLKNENIPVLWRPFHEASGQWFWWGAAGADTFKSLWIEMFNELQAAGLDNLIWVWTSCGGDDSWYPGDEYVDIVGRDLYGDDVASCESEYSALATTYPNKMITLSECGWSEYTASRVATITEQWNAGAKWSWFMPWYDNDDAANQHADKAWWEDAMSNSNVITRDQVSY